MTYEEFYKDKYEVLKEIEQKGREKLEKKIQSFDDADDDFKKIIYFRTRIKTPESVLEKLKRQGFEPTLDSALKNLHDVVGFRVVCAFSDDVYEIAQWLIDSKSYEIVKKKDYISYPKPNGYRSLHLILRTTASDGEQYEIEVQLRTIAEDFWASLEHKMKYKKNIKNSKLISSELKRCADEIASIDITMQSLKDVIEFDGDT